jgi:hypothetical protein
MKRDKSGKIMKALWSGGMRSLDPNTDYQEIDEMASEMQQIDDTWDKLAPDTYMRKRSKSSDDPWGDEED